MAEEKKDTKAGEAKKPAAKKPAASKSAAKKPAARKPAAKKPPAPKKLAAAKKPAAKKETATKEPATKAKAESAAEATSKTAEPKAAAASKQTAPAAKAPAKKPAARRSRKPAPEEAPQRPVVNARARYVRVAPRKARLIADQVRGLPLEDAQTLLRFSPRSAAQDIAKLISSAAANAENNHDLVADDLVIKDISVDEGPTLRRYRPRALGRATRINKRTSHIKVALTPEDGS
jgi:ribosomal protein L22